ncbi:MAG TPA: glycerol-3-phosphate acyltransferase [Fervidobacterium sp.]|nr:glycerol-3-phosphate acyltransferase [Fervidobacterium sp.]
MGMKELLFLFFCYFLGSANTALFVTWAVKGMDIRHFGDGNAGSTNVFRHVSKPLGIFVFFADFLKGMIPFYVGSILALPAYVLAVGGSLVVVGHDFPLFFGFRGGTGIASVFGGVFGAAPMIGIQLFAFIIMIFSACYIFQAHFFGFSYLEEGEAAGFLFLIYLVLSNGDSMLKMYFFLSLLVIVFRQKEKVVEIFSSRLQREKR